MIKLTGVALTFLICVTALSTTEGRPLRCQCVGTYTGKPISIDKIDSRQIFPTGPHCKNVEIIATVKHKNGKMSNTCLNPSDAWVQLLIEEINKKNEKSSSIKSQSESTTKEHKENILF